MSELQKPGLGPARPNLSIPRLSDGRSAQRKPTPSPLQVSQISTPTTDSFAPVSPQELGSPQSLRGDSMPSYSPRSPPYSPVIPPDYQKSPRQRLDAFLAAERSNDGHEGQRSGTSEVSPVSPSITPKEGAYKQFRNFSTPNPTLSPSTDSPPHSPSRSITTSARFPGGRPEPYLVARQSSIDSTMSSVSSTTSYSHLAPQDPTSPNPGEIAQLVATAGSPDAAIRHLLKEKKHSAAQNEQLWRLVNKQRTLVLGLNKDLERTLQDKERYKKRLKEYHAQAALLSTHVPEALRKPSPAASEPSDSQDDLPIQRHSVREDVEGRVTADTKSRLANEPRDAVEATVSQPTAFLSTVHETAPGAARGLGLTEVTDDPQTGVSGIEEKSNIDEPAQNPTSTSVPLHIHKRKQSGPEAKSGPSTPDIDNTSSRGSFTARRSITTPRTIRQSPLLESSQFGEENTIPSPSTRKAPPAPLNLRPSPHAAEPSNSLSPDDHSGSDYGDVGEHDTIPIVARGRKKTREEDDDERQLALLREQESRSQSKKEKRSKSAAEKNPNADTLPLQQNFPKSPAIRSFSPDETSVPHSNSLLGSLQGHLSPPASLAGVLNQPTVDAHATAEQTVFAPFPLSPGLPVSPRPVDRPLHSPLPRLPRDGANVFLSSPPLSPRSGVPPMLSPRAPRFPIPLPPHTPNSLASPFSNPAETQHSILESSPSINGIVEEALPAAESALRSTRLPAPLGVQDKHEGGSIYRGLVSDAYPDLLLPPNAIPSILVTVTSSRLRPSRNSTLALKGSDEEPVFTLGIFARSDMQQLWRVEKATASLPLLDKQLKQVCGLRAQLPDRSLFSGHAPTKIDARKQALETYFETILDTPMDETAALITCRYLSTQAIPAEEQDIKGKIKTVQPTISRGPDGRITKEGFLTKRGQKFGGWKARFFVLDEPCLRYYEAPGGSLLGTIKLPGAQIGRQTSQTKSQSPARGEEQESQYRHAFLILEPKRKDSNNFIRHALCAESDQERDQWVAALLQYIGDYSWTEDTSRPSPINNESNSSKLSLQSRRKEAGPGSTDPEDYLLSTPYEDTVPAQAPTRALSTSQRQTKTPSPVNSVHTLGHASQSSKIISGPTNGAVIHNAGAWGNRPLDSPKVKEREQKKRGLWGFREKSSSDLTPHHPSDPTTNMLKVHSERLANVRAVFGIPLADAAEYCMAPGTDVCLPAVVYRCLEYLEAKDVANEEGIFRLSGSNVVIKALRERFNNEGDLDLFAEGHYYDVHAVASLLKMYLRELPSTVLTRELHVEFLQVLELDDKAKKIKAYNVLVHKLPLPNWTLLRALSAFLIGIVNNSNVNKMSVRNVGIVFSPTLNIPAPVFAAFLTDFDAIFGTEPDDSTTTSIEMSMPSPLTPEDIRSPRHQLFSELPTPSFNQETFPHHGLGVTYDSPLHPNGESDGITGFIPLQPSYEAPTSSSSSSSNHARTLNVTVPGPEYASFQRTLGSTGIMRDTKSRRRESSMLMMSMGLGPGQRKSSMPIMRSENESASSETSYRR